MRVCICTTEEAYQQALRQADQVWENILEAYGYLLKSNEEDQLWFEYQFEGYDYARETIEAMRRDADEDASPLGAAIKGALEPGQVLMEMWDVCPCDTKPVYDALSFCGSVELPHATAYFNDTAHLYDSGRTESGLEVGCGAPLAAGAVWAGESPKAPLVRHLADAAYDIDSDPAWNLWKARERCRQNHWIHQHDADRKRQEGRKRIRQKRLESLSKAPRASLAGALQRFHRRNNRSAEELCDIHF